MSIERPTTPVGLHKALEAIWGTPPGLGRLSSVNHTVLGKRFMVVALFFFAVGGVLSMLIRAQLATPNSAFVGPELYNQIFTMHGTVMMFLFAIPMLEGFAMYMLPKMLGARDLAFPRLTAYGFWCYVFGGAIILVAMLAGVAPDTGWFMYTPLASNVYTPGINADVWLLGITFVEISALTAAVEITVSILKMRAPGMSLDRMPLFAWYMLVTALMMVFGFPPLILGSILLEMERAFGLPFFDPERGGDPLLWQHLFWLFGHPEVYIIFLPAAGALSMMIPTFAGRPIIGYRAIIVAIIALGFLSFGLWVHHMFTVGIPHLALAFFSAASALVAIPTAVQIFAWIATLAHGKPRHSVPMLYVFGFLFVFVIGGLTGVMIAMVPFNTQAHDSHFIVAHLHYVLVGGFVFPMLAGLYYWLPHITGRLSLHRLSIPAFWLIFIGFNLTFFLMHLTGLMGMPRRISTYPSSFGWDWLNLISSVGGFILTMGFALVFADLMLQIRFGRRQRRDPWNAATLEWATPTPPSSYNFAAIPTIDTRADRLSPREIGPVAAGGRGWLGFARDNQQETMGVDMASGRAEHIIVLPRRTFLPLITGIATAAVFLSLLFKLYLAAAIAAALVIGIFCFWSAALGRRRDLGPMPAGNDVDLPFGEEVRGNIVELGNRFAVASDATLYASLLFGVLYLIVVRDWPGMVPLHIPWPALGAGCILAFSGAGMAWRARNRIAAERPAEPYQAVAAILALAALTGFALALAAIPDWTGHARQAGAVALLIYVIVHQGIAALISLHGLVRNRLGYVSRRRSTDLELGLIWQLYAALTALPAAALTAGLLALGGAS